MPSVLKPSDDLCSRIDHRLGRENGAGGRSGVWGWHSVPHVPCQASHGDLVLSKFGYSFRKRVKRPQHTQTPFQTRSSLDDPHLLQLSCETTIDLGSHPLNR